MMAEQLEPQQPCWKIWHQLPLRPPLAELESLTSYLMRVAQANGHQKVTELVTLAGGISSTWQSLCFFPDGSATSVPGLTTLTGRTQSDLEAMTFLPLGRHFGRANSTKTLRRFFQGCLASHLRYCPGCLAEHKFPYYRLPWRFLPLSGCVTHQCQLLDCCGHCGARIPLLSDHPALPLCSTCRRDLRTCQSSPLSEDASRLLSHRTSDLLFLLSTPVQSQEEASRVMVGKHYSFIRQQQGLSSHEVASLARLNPQIFSEIEYAGVSKKATFLDYVQYADVLGISLEEVFSVQIPPPSLDEDTLLARVDEVIQEWGNLEQSAQNRPTSGISKRVGVSIATLRTYPRIHSRLTAWYTQRSYILARENHQREEELVQLVMNAIQQLEILKQPATQQQIARMVGKTYQYLRTYPRVEALLIQVASKNHLSKPLSYLASAQKRLFSSTNAPEKEAADEGEQS